LNVYKIIYVYIREGKELKIRELQEVTTGMRERGIEDLERLRRGKKLRT